MKPNRFYGKLQLFSHIKHASISSKEQHISTDQQTNSSNDRGNDSNPLEFWYFNLSWRMIQFDGTTFQKVDFYQINDRLQ
jgi:hypothetical protein